MAPDTDGVAKVQKLKELEATLGNNIFLYVDLDALPRSLQVRETRFTHQPQGNDAPGDANFVLWIEFGARSFPIFFDQRRRRIAPSKFPWISVESEPLNLLELLTSLLKLVMRLELQTENPFFKKSQASIAARTSPEQETAIHR